MAECNAETGLSWIEPHKLQMIGKTVEDIQTITSHDRWKMKSAIIFMTFLGILIQSSINGSESASINGKTYVNAHQIYLDDSSINVEIDGAILQVKRLYVDQEGIYIKHAEFNRSDYWTCGICGSSNREGKTRCWYCGELKEWGLHLN